jgi:outer membrane protein assembly factor BamB
MTSRNTLRTALLASALMGLAACSSDKMPPAPLAEFKPMVAMAQQWSVAVESLNAAPSVLRGASGTQLLTAQGADVVAYQASTGAIAWRTSLGVVEAPLGVSENQQMVLALVQGSEAVGLNAANGQVLWRNSLPAEMRTQAASVGGVFVVLTADGRIVGLDEQTGRRRWALARTMPPLSLSGAGAVAAASKSIAVIGLPGGKAVGVNVNTGKFVWEANIALTRGVNDVERIADVLPQWVAVPGLGLCATTYRQRAACVDEKGDITHAQDMSAMSGLAVNGQQWFALEEGSLKAWTLKSQSVNPGQAPIDWSFDGLKGRSGNTYSAVAAFGGAAFVHDSLGSLHVLSSQTGKTIARVSTGLSADVHLQPVLLDGKGLLIAASNKAIQAWLPAQ